MQLKEYALAISKNGTNIYNNEIYKTESNRTHTKINRDPLSTSVHHHQCY